MGYIFSLKDEVDHTQPLFKLIKLHSVFSKDTYIDADLKYHIIKHSIKLNLKEE